MRLTNSKAFTLVEILVVVVILGILAAIIIPSVVNATDDSASTSTYNELQKLRRHVEVFRSANNNSLPAIVAGEGTWGELVSAQYLSAPPVNAWVGGANRRVIIIANAPDGAYQETHGWIFDNTTGDIWAGGFDGNDAPHPR